MRSAAMALRGLRHKNLLQMPDMNYLTESFKRGIPQHLNLAPLLRDLLITFLLKADGGHFVFAETFEEVKCVQCKLDIDRNYIIT